MNSPAISDTTVAELETISRTMVNIIKNSFGPGGQVTLMSSSTGHVALSADGLTVLSSLHLAHPTARSIVKSLESFVSLYGDGCKCIALYLSTAFQEIQKLANEYALTSLDAETFIRSYLSKCLLSFSNLHLPLVLNKMTTQSTEMMDKELKSPSLNEIVSKIMKTVVGCSLPSQSRAHLLSVMTEYLLDGCNTVNDVKKLCEWFNTSVFLCPYQLFSSSQVRKGIFLMSNLYNGNNLLTDITFICMECSMDGTAVNDEDYIIHLNNAEDLVDHRYSTVKRFLSSVKDADISLIITSLKVPDMCLQLCHASGVAVIDCVDEADLTWICAICKKSPITSVRDIIDAKNLSKAVLCREVVIAQKRYTSIILDGIACHPKSLFLCGPSEGICQQMKIIVKKCVTVIKQFLKDFKDFSIDSTEPLTSSSGTKLVSNVVSAGGFFEVLLSKHLSIYSKEKAEHKDIKMCCRLLQSILMAVPRTLYQKQGVGINNLGDCSSSVNFLHELNNIGVINSDFGLKQHLNLQGFVNKEALDVLSIKVASFCTTISQVISLVRIDQIVGVKCRSNENEDNEETTVTTK